MLLTGTRLTGTLERTARTTFSSALVASALIAAMLVATPSANAQTTDDPHYELADLYRRVNLDLDRHFNDSYALWEHFATTYLDEDIREPLGNRAARHNEDSIREHLSEMKKARYAHRNNAKVLGKIDDAPAKMANWAQTNITVSLQRLWEIKIWNVQHAFGLLARDAARDFEAATSAAEARLKEIDEEYSLESDRAAARAAFLKRLQAEETERARVLRLRAHALAQDLAQWRARLAAKGWRWVHYFEETEPNSAAKFSRTLVYRLFGHNMQARKADPLDPIFGEDLPDETMLDWLGVLERKPDLLGLRVVLEPDTPTPLTLNLTRFLPPVETLDPSRLTIAPTPSLGRAPERLAGLVDRTTQALGASETREARALFRLVAALDNEPIPGDLLDQTKDHLVQLRHAITLTRRPLEFSAQVAAARIERDTLAGVLREAEESEPVDAEQVADLKADLTSADSILTRLQDTAEKAEKEFLANDALRTAWEAHRATNVRLHGLWSGLKHTRLVGALAEWPETLPVLEGDPAAILLDLEDTANGLTRLIQAAAPARDADRSDQYGAITTLTDTDAHQLRLVRQLRSARIQAARLAAQITDSADTPATTGDTTSPAAAFSTLADDLRRNAALFELQAGNAAGWGPITPGSGTVPANQVRRLAARLATLQRADAPMRRDGALLEVNANAPATHGTLLEVLGEAVTRGLPLTGAAALVFDDAQAETAQNVVARFRTVREKSEADVNALLHVLTLRPLANGAVRP